MKLEKLFDLRYIALSSEKTLNHLRLAQKRSTGYLKDNQIALDAEKISPNDLSSSSDKFLEPSLAHSARQPK